MVRWVILGLGMTVWTCFTYGDDSKPTLNWYLLSFEPIHITEGPNKGKGFADVQLDLYMEKLPDYKHNIVVANVPRIREKLQSKRQLVATPSHVGPLDRFGKGVLTSTTNLYAPPIGVVVRSENLKRWHNSSRLSLEADLFNQTDLRTAIVKGAAEHIHHSAPELIKRFNTSVTYLNDSNPQVYFKMLSLKRVDYFFTYPFAFQMITTRLGLQGSMHFLPLTEADNYIEARAYISDAPGAQALLKKINEISATADFKQRSTQALIQYLPENIRAEASKRNGAPF